MTDLLSDLLRESRQRGFLGPGPVEIHLDHARAFAVAAPAIPDLAADLGAGGGLPGLVLAFECWPESRWVLIDAQQKRTAFLAEAVDRLGMADRVAVITDRAELAARDPDLRGSFDLVVARSFGPPPVVAECGAPLLRLGGSLVVSEPPVEPDHERWPTAGLAELGCGPAELMEVGEAPGFHFVRIAQVERSPDRYPRRVGVPTKRPVF